ncbi:acyl-CoA dehydrogenase family protein [Actinomadura madurae]|uniref:acyl-CoA dehydrogenase family protein n=1 Tax=Actinomadura madurae TaxID=1993 RepID=UPI002026CB94|nr:acyl-CoA dehydrogenase family protein [Actinomadura madurae]MCP9952951.1 acyl-CoA dehydrogenase family protein [Actinomadura madurae]MCP9982171.1 acyl-CoA dehydrogenase family protein [Actinomadura madurae]MCQ0006303.1 acyl-CoA dehydrogenase family protein [Actinomadura madurae]MCQ0018419.1 acyl-CoA dehydrogenase family protein [Actinomadura madurae]URM98435.1 acyl-CoA dehydrogenase family protein [Actinomadura madurae]
MEPQDFADVLKAVRSFVREQVVPREEEIEETDAIPEQLRRTSRDMGLFGYALPEEYGGLGLSLSEEVRLVFELGYASPAFRSMFGTSNGIAGQVLVNSGTDEQKDAWLPRLASGEVVGAFALTEAEAGSDPSTLATTAARDGGDYVVNGAKRFITNAPEADVFMVFARTGGSGSRGISTFLVERGTDGLKIGPSDQKMGQRGAHTAEVFFDGVRVPATAMVGTEGTGFRTAMASLAHGRLSIAAVCVGLAQRILDETVAYAKERSQGGRTIGEYQLVQGLVADSQTELYAGRSMVLEAARAYDAGEDTKQGPSCAKYFCSEMVGRVADRAVQVYGGMGYMRGVAVERFYRDVRLFRIYEGTSQIQQLVIARNLLR